MAREQGDAQAQATAVLEARCDKTYERTVTYRDSWAPYPPPS